jgi:hypothetical protein
MRWFIFLLALATAATAAPRLDVSKMEEHDGRKLPEDRQWPRWDVLLRFRPWVAEDDGGTLVVENKRIHSVTNQKAIDIGLVSTDRVPGKMLTYAQVIVRHCDISQINRDEHGAKQGLHIDFLRICGGGDRQERATDVLVEDVYIHDGTALPLLVQDGKYGTITFRRVKVHNTTIGGVQIATINTGSVQQVIVEDCPDLGVALMGRPGSIGKCIVRNSPGARVNDVETVNGRSGAQIIQQTAQALTRPTTAPATTAPAARPSLRLAGPSADGKVKAVLEGAMGDDVTFVIFEAFDADDYRVCPAVYVTEAPWQAELVCNKPGKIRIQATVRRTGGASDAPLVAPLPGR